MSSPTFSIVHATNRPWGWQAVYAQYLRRFHGYAGDWEQNVEYILVFDEGQREQFKWHHQTFGIDGMGAVRSIANPNRPCYIDAANYGVEKSTGRIILLATDDMFPPEDWNLQIAEALHGDVNSNISLGEQVLWVNDGVFPHIMTMQIFTRQWWARYGFAFNPAYQSMNGDHDFTLRAQRDGVVVDARTNPRLQWEHCHYRAGTRPKDGSDDVNAGAARYVEGWRQLEKDWPGYNGKPMIDALYDMAVATPTDINEHLPVLRELGRGKKILELGVRTGCSSIAFLAGRPESLTSIDIDWSQLDPQVIAGAELAGVDWTRFEMSSTYAHTFLPGPEYRRYDLLFIDTLHTADQIREELRIHAPHADRIVIHDTVANWTKGENGQPGIGGPILDLLEPVDGVWHVEREYANNNGLMILCRDGVANGKPMIDALYDMAVATPTDINEHLPVLRELGRGKRILELGVRTGCSSIAFLAGRPNALTSIDIDWSQLDPQVIAAAELAELKWDRWNMSSLIPGSWSGFTKFDILFIDTLHTADQIREELHIHAPHADRIIIHDTVANWTKGENGQPGIGGPILDLLEPMDSVWCVEREYTNNNGLMILRRDGVAPFDYGCVPRDKSLGQHLAEVLAPA